MTPADRRISDLINKWLTSIDLHLQYVELSDTEYARVQPWPVHERPTRWVLEVARQKVLELKAHFGSRQALGDSKLSEALELMAFLANLVGLQNIQRFIPLADPKRAADTSDTATVIKPPSSDRRRAAPPDDTTREMPRLQPAPVAKPVEAQVVAKAISPAPEEKKSAPRAASAKSATSKTAIGNSDMKSKIIADAVRLLKWGKSWHELPETIGRIADRPPVAEIRKVLRTHRAEIESKAQKT